MFSIKTALLASTLLSIGALADTYQDYELNKFEGFYKAKKNSAFVISKVGVFSSCQSAMYDGGILEVQIKKDGGEVLLKEKYEYLGYPFNKKDPSNIYVTRQRDTIELANSQSRAYDYVYPASHDGGGIQSHSRAYTKSVVKLRDGRLEATKYLVPKKIGAVVKSIQSRHILELGNGESALNIRVAKGGARVLGVTFSSTSDCDYERISKAEYDRLSSELDKKLSK